ncbi:hypothetical protein CANCADRAFT_44473 [Tortispora caseinolytica NRRL Y-17796]|uniref:Translationally-controlled tumor protein homolog n=1 Tax=Tortispora caseinolytica NRRL Y-17796 TaxID=767744 RepID=A0A1E4TGJ0_9ASCO|nr:hypothetical protein CANCADRAFT_44473 [Tortispora caseinolytica NRRL Y-17796]
MLDRNEYYSGKIGAPSEVDKSDEYMFSELYFEPNEIVYRFGLNILPHSKMWCEIYMTQCIERLKEVLRLTRPAEVEKFQKQAEEYLMHVLDNFDKYSFYLGPLWMARGMLVLGGVRENGTPFCAFWKDGLIGLEDGDAIAV